MLSDEERKAIENLKIEYEKLMKEDNILFPLYKSDAKRLIDIIEKQSKEIEELKEDKEIIKRNYEDLVDENEKFLYGSAVYLMGKDDTNSKWKDKIKAKIEEVKDGTYDAKIVLQSLLEKE